MPGARHRQHQPVDEHRSTDCPALQVRFARADAAPDTPPPLATRRCVKRRRGSTEVSTLRLVLDTSSSCRGSCRRPGGSIPVSALEARDRLSPRSACAGRASAFGVPPGLPACLTAGAQKSVGALAAPYRLAGTRGAGMEPASAFLLTSSTRSWPDESQSAGRGPVSALPLRSRATRLLRLPRAGTVPARPAPACAGSRVSGLPHGPAACEHGPRARARAPPATGRSSRTPA